MISESNAPEKRENGAEGRVLGLITARGGSKGIPNKNIVPVGGKPLVYWVCEKAKRCQSLCRVIISSDSPAILEVARGCGIEVPFERPAGLAGDKAMVSDVILHALEWMRVNRGETYEYVCLFQPTSPFALPSDYDRAVDMAFENKADTVISVYRNERIHPAYTMYNLGPDGRATWYLGGGGVNRMSRRQDIQPVFVRAGSVYVFRAEHLLATKSLYGEAIYAIELPEERVLDINTPLDLKIARCLAEEYLVGRLDEM